MQHLRLDSVLTEQIDEERALGGRPLVSLTLSCSPVCDGATEGNFIFIKHLNYSDFC